MDVADLGELLGAQHRRRQHDLVAVLGRLGEQVLLAADGDAGGGDELLADRVEWRVGHLGEELGEVVEERARLAREDRQRGVGTHRANGLLADLGHVANYETQVLLAVAEVLLLTHD